MAADLSSIPLSRIDGSADTLAGHAGKVLLVVNVASKCGLTPQYEGLEKLYKQHKDHGFEVLGFPANDFGAQEPGTDEEIVSFCSANYGVSLPTLPVPASSHFMPRLPKPCPKSRAMPLAGASACAAMA